MTIKVEYSKTARELQARIVIDGELAALKTYRYDSGLSDADIQADIDAEIEKIKLFCVKPCPANSEIDV